MRKRPALQYKRALITWVCAYITITIIGVCLFLFIAAIQNTGSTSDPLRDPSYLLEEKLLPFANLMVWTTFAAIYFRKRRGAAQNLSGEPIQLGVLWLIIALPLDFLGFVVVPNPLSLTAHDFYLGQFPWIYLTYLAVLLSPVCAAAFIRGSGERRQRRRPKRGLGRHTRRERLSRQSHASAADRRSAR